MYLLERWWGRGAWGRIDILPRSFFNVFYPDTGCLFGGKKGNNIYIHKQLFGKV